MKKDIDTISTPSLVTYYANAENSLLRSYYNLSGLAQKIFLKDIGLGGSLAKGYDLFTQTYTGNKFYISDFIKDFKLEDSGQLRQSIYKAVKELTDVSITIPSDDGKILTSLHLYTAYRINLNEKSITLYYTNEMVELLKRNPQYTKIEFEEISNLTSKYAIKWFTNFSSYKYQAGTGENKENTFWKIYSFNEIRDFFQLGKKYKSDTELRKYVIELPIKEINERSFLFQIRIFYQKSPKENKTKSNRGFTHVKFEITINDPDKFKTIDISQVLNVLGASISTEQSSLIQTYKERFIEEARKMYQLLLNQPDLNVPSEELKNFYLDVFKKMIEEIQKDILVLKQINL